MLFVQQSDDGSSYYFLNKLCHVKLPMTKKKLLYPLVTNTKRKLTNVEKEILKGLEDPRTQHYFADAEQDGWDAFEDVRLVCYPKKKKYKIKDIDIDETGTNKNTASASLSVEEIEKRCPSKNYHRLWYHTHNSSSSAPSELDQRSGQDIYAGGLGPNMCAVGMNGITCLIQDSDDPLLINGKWNEKFFENFLKKDSVDFKDIPYYNDKGEIEKSKIALFDQIICYTASDGVAKCDGKDFSADGQLEIDLGAGFSSLQINGDADMYVQGNGDTFTIFSNFDGKLNCVKYETEEGGTKLSCH